MWGRGAAKGHKELGFQILIFLLAAHVNHKGGRAWKRQQLCNVSSTTQGEIGNWNVKEKNAAATRRGLEHTKREGT